MYPDPLAHPIPLLRLLYPGALPEIPFGRPPKKSRTDGLLTTDEAADYLAISPETLRRLCRQKAITFVNPTPSEYRFRLANLDEYIASRTNRRRSAVR